MSKKQREKRKLKRKLKKVSDVPKHKQNFLKKKGDELNKDLPKSEIWFNNQMKFAGLKIKDLKPNKPFLGFIPDYRSDKYNLIIEVDGSFHNSKEIKKKDNKKQLLYEKAGYTVIRVVAYNENSLRTCFIKIKDLLNNPK
jgi:very-short-patch-repair endonuclease